MSAAPIIAELIHLPSVSFRDISHESKAKMLLKWTNSRLPVVTSSSRTLLNIRLIREFNTLDC